MLVAGSYVETSYADQSVVDAAIGNGDPALLFFYASWCGYCQAKDGLLKTMYGENEFALSVYKVDYDTAEDLKERYGVFQQDTVVRIDESGEAQESVLGATEADLRKLLSSS